MTDKSEVISHISELCKAHNITLAEIGAALTGRAETIAPVTEEAKSSILSRVFSYLGGTFIFAGIAAFIGMHWDDMTTPMRIIVTFGIGFAIYLFAVAASDNERVKKAVPGLILMACLLQPTGMFVAIDAYFNSGSDPRYATLVVFSFMFIQQLCTFLARKLTSLLFMSLLFGMLVYLNLLDIFEVHRDTVGITLGISLLCITFSLRNTVHEPISGLWNMIGGIALLAALFDAVEDKPIELLFLAAASGMVYVSVLARSRMLLFISILAVLSYISYFTAEHFANSIGWPLCLILLGGAFIGISSMAVRISRKYIRS